MPVAKPAVSSKPARKAPVARKAAAPARPAAKRAQKAKAQTLTTQPAVQPPKPAKPAVPVKPAAPVKAAKPVKAVEIKTVKTIDALEKEKKPKLVRDSFTIPKPEYAVMETLKLRAGKLALPIKKSEILRAGIKALAAMSDAAFLAALAAVPNLKTGRPKAKKA